MCLCLYACLCKWDHTVTHLEFWLSSRNNKINAIFNGCVVKKKKEKRKFRNSAAQISPPMC